MESNPWVTFCISTYNRPSFLSQQLTLISQQTFKDFEVVISDNDPQGSAKEVVSKFDSRFRYFVNGQNLGMIPSFNKSIERANTPYIVMVTDDDPIQIEFLTDMYDCWKKNPGLSVYAGVDRTHSKPSQLEIITPHNFIIELLDSNLTKSFLWSSFVLKKVDAVACGSIPNYGSPHLADHALLAKTGSTSGGLFVNKKYSHLSSHDTNFSKSNFNYYVNGCRGFHDTMKAWISDKQFPKSTNKLIITHLGEWFIANIFNLKRYYSIKKKDPEKLAEINSCAEEILSFSFMRKYRLKYFMKSLIFKAKKVFGLLH